MEGKFFRCWCDTLRHAKKIYILIKSFKIRNIEGESGESKESFDPSAFEKLYNWEKNHFWFTSRNERIIHLAKRYLKEPFYFLEIGCGTGFVIEGLSKTFRTSSFKGSEYHPEGLEFAKKGIQVLSLFKWMQETIPISENLIALVLLM